MLKALRNGAKSGFLKYILLGFLVLAAGGLVLTDVGGFFRGGVSGNLVAEGKGIKISTIQFDKVVRRILARQGMGPEEAYNLGLINQILNSEVQSQILTREAQNLGIKISDDVVLEQISKIAEPMAQGGMSKSEAIGQVLRSQGVSEAEFIQAIRQEMGNTLFQNAMISNATTISEAQARDLYQYQNELRDVRGIILRNSDNQAAEAPTDENLMKYYEANKVDFLISEKRDITIATLKKEMLADKVEIPEEDLIAAYEENIASYEKPERRKLRQAIVDIQTDAQRIAKEVKAGKSLKTAVKTVTGNTSPYLGENNFEQGGLLEEIADPVFASEEGDVIGPIQTALGWHVLVVKEIIEPKTQEFSEIKENLRDGMLQDKLLEDLVDTANILDDRLASGEKMAEVVADMGLTTESFKNFNQAGLDDKGKDLFASYQGDRAPILESTFEYFQDDITPVLELNDGRFVAIRIDNVKEKSYEPFESVKAQLKTRWMIEQKNLANKQRAEEALEALKTGKELEDIAQQYGAKIQKFDNLKRASTPPAPITLPSLRTIYDAQERQPLMLNTVNGYIIGQVTDIDLPTLDGKEKEIQALMNETKQVLPQETIAQYINTLSMEYDVKINDRILKQVYGTPAQN